MKSKRSAKACQGARPRVWPCALAAIGLTRFIHLLFVFNGVDEIAPLSFLGTFYQDKSTCP
jgi:hypothetical protein